MGCGASTAAGGAQASASAPAAKAGGAPAPAAAAAGGASYPPNGLAPTVKDLPEWITLGCGDADYICKEKGAMFPGDKCPAALPDLSNHGNLCATALRENPDWYAK